MNIRRYASIEGQGHFLTLAQGRVHTNSNKIFSETGPAGSVVEHPLRDREVVGSSPGRAIPKALKMVPMATLLGAQHYKASIGFFSPNKYHNNMAKLTKTKKSDNNQCLYSPEDRMEEWQ